MYTPDTAIASVLAAASTLEAVHQSTSLHVLLYSLHALSSLIALHMVALRNLLDLHVQEALDVLHGLAVSNGQCV